MTSNLVAMEGLSTPLFTKGYLPGAGFVRFLKDCQQMSGKIALFRKVSYYLRPVPPYMYMWHRDENKNCTPTLHSACGIKIDLEYSYRIIRLIGATRY